MQNDEERDFPSVERTFAVLGPARRRLALWDPAILRMQIRLSGIAAPTGLEGRRARWVRRRFERIGFPDATLDEAGNVLAMRHGMVPGNSPVVVCAHLDTVFPAGTDLSIREDGDRLVGPGICDNGRGLAAMLAIAAILASPAVRLRRSILFSATTREEGLGDLEGAKHLFANDARHASSAIVIDGAGDERVVHRALGSRRFRIVFSGEGGHSWAAFGTPNPVHAAAIAGARLAAMSLPREPRTTLTVGRIGGGISVNAIPRDGWLEVDVRSSSQSELERAEAELRRACAAAAGEENSRRARGTPPLTHAIHVIGRRPCGSVSTDHGLVRLAEGVTRAVGREPELLMASTDANVPISLGIPAIAIGGGGRGGDAHTPDEWYDNRSGSLGLARALAIICGAAGLDEAAD